MIEAIEISRLVTATTGEIYHNKPVIHSNTGVASALYATSKIVFWEDVIDKPDRSVAALQYKFSPSVTWGDEFNYTGTPDPMKWNKSIGNGYFGWGNNELQYFTGRSENVRVEDGKLKITARSESYKGFNYTSAKIVSAKKQRYGRYVINAKMPLGSGLWPAIFGFGERHKDYNMTTWPKCGEFDIVEVKGQNIHEVNYNVHTANSYGASNMVTLPTNVALDQFNEYRIDWTPDYIKWYFNGKLMRTFSKNGKGYDGWPFDDYFDLNMCLSVGGAFVGTNINTDVMPASMEIEYVRYYALMNIKNSAQLINPVKPVLVPASANISLSQSQTFRVTNVPANSTVHWYAFGNDLVGSGASGPQITITPAMLQAVGAASGSSFEFFVDFINSSGVSSRATRAKLTIQ
ncbi:MAG: family 16 glycosylhydrolase [Pedobacter sp.]|uniref:family 16 glycosylhydrolase n=1 Tax=Pedobacter sp. TaxID=1411316 RepID=UPI003394AF71